MIEVAEVLRRSFSQEELELTDEELLPRIIGGEKRLYEIIIRKYNQRLYRVGLSITKEDSEVEDIMQNCYLKAYEHLSNFKGKAKFSTWLTRIMINESLKRVKQRKKLQLVDVLDGITNYWDTIFAKVTNPEEKVIQQEMKGLLEKAIKNLSDKYRSVYMLREVERLSIAETQDLLGISAANVKVRLHRAKEQLKKELYDMTRDKEVFEFHLTRCSRVTKNVMDSI